MRNHRNKKNKNETLIRANIDQMAKGWNTKSATEFSKPFAGNADYVIWDGFHIKNFPSGIQGLQHVFETSEKTSKATYTVEQIRYLRKDVVAVHVVGEMKDEVNTQQNGKGRITLIMTKEKNKWVIATFQNTGIQTN